MQQAKAEEKVLIEQFGEEYVKYQQEVGMFLPKMWNQEFGVISENAWKRIHLLSVVFLILNSIKILENLIIKKAACDRLDGRHYVTRVHEFADLHDVRTELPIILKNGHSFSDGSVCPGKRI